LDILKVHSERFLDSMNLCNVCLMAQGTNTQAAWSIAQAGFGVAATLDKGWFGQGVYFTSELKYAESYANYNTQPKPAIIIAAVIPGNPYPIIENPFIPLTKQEQQMNPKTDRKISPKGYYGKAPEVGFQSHSTIVNFKTFPNCEILSPWKPRFNSYSVDELVAQTPQALPIFIIKMKPEILPKRSLVLEFEGTGYGEFIIENEQNFKNADYLIAAAQHFIKTAQSLQIDYFNPVGGGYQPLTDPKVLSNNITKLRATVVVSKPQPLPVNSPAKPATLPAKPVPAMSPATPSTENLKTDEIKKWKVDDVIKWLKEVGLDRIAPVAQEDEWDGRILIGLNKVRHEKDNFKNECQELGLEKPALQMKLKVELETLFLE